jgi:acylphosphatase
VSDQTPKPVSEFMIRIENPDPLVTITNDGTVIIHKEGADKEAAKKFYEALQLEGKTLHEKIAEKVSEIAEMEPIYAKLQATISKQSNDINTLNDLLRDRGYGQGEIDFMACQEERIRLAEGLAEYATHKDDCHKDDQCACGDGYNCLEGVGCTCGLDELMLAYRKVSDKTEKE